MKKILILLLAASAAVSCLSGGTFSQTYTADITFEFPNDIYLNSFKDSVYVMKDGDAFIYSQYPVFFYQKQLNGTFHGAFLLSYLQGEKNGELTREPADNDAYRVHAASGATDSKTYTVFYDNPVTSMMPAHDIEFSYKDIGEFTPLGCYVNNTTLVARKIKEHFKDGDKLVLKATGVKADGARTEASITLAEYSEAKDSVMYNWTAFALSSLGSVSYIDFEVQSTCPDVPGYFCMDGLVAGVSVEY
jgi:hypothetical protein